MDESNVKRDILAVYKGICWKVYKSLLDGELTTTEPKTACFEAIRKDYPEAVTEDLEKAYTLYCEEFRQNGYQMPSEEEQVSLPPADDKLLPEGLTLKPGKETLPPAKQSEIFSFDLYADALDIELQPELIHGVLRQGHKLLIVGGSKTGKSFLLIQLACAITTGGKWLGMECRQGKVLYINLEIDKPSFVRRFKKVYEARGEQPPKGMLDLMCLRGKVMGLKSLIDDNLAEWQSKGYSAIIIDPIYKVMDGEENSNTDVAKFCNQFDRICEGTGASVIFAHHHAKGSQGAKAIADRASGAGSFVRDPDAFIDVSDVKPSEAFAFSHPDCNPLEVGFTLREFPHKKPFKAWFDYPLHYVDTDNLLHDAHVVGSPEENLSLSPKRVNKAEQAERIMDAFVRLDNGHGVQVGNLAIEVGVNSKTIKNYIDEALQEKLERDSKGIVKRKNP